MKKVVITGAESSGKSTLAADLSDSFKVPLVQEYSRIYLSNLNKAYQFEDLDIIAKQQLQLEKQASLTNDSFIICDTGLLVLKIWSEYKYGNLAPYIADQWDIYECDLFILPHYDIPYEQDPLRENPDDRHILFQLYQDILEQNGLKYLIVDGTIAERTAKAQKAIKALLLSNT